MHSIDLSLATVHCWSGDCFSQSSAWQKKVEKKKSEPLISGLGSPAAFVYEDAVTIVEFDEWLECGCDVIASWEENIGRIYIYIYILIYRSTSARGVEIIRFGLMLGVKTGVLLRCLEGPGRDGAVRVDRIL